MKLGWVLACWSLALGAVPAQPAEPTRRLFLIGIDGAGWNVMDPLLKAGRLPYLDSLIREGIRSPLKSMVPTVSPALWTSVATGKTFHKHGINNFAIKVRPDGQRDFAIMHVTSNIRRSKALWNIVGECGRRVAFVGWWVTWPAEQVNGHMVSSYVPLSQTRTTARPAKGTLVADAAGQTWPPELFDQLQPLIRTPDSVTYQELSRFTAGFPLDLRQPNIAGLVWAYAADETYRAAAQCLLELEPDVNLFGLYFNGIDVVGHRFGSSGAALGWHLRGVVPRYYEYIDEILGQLLAVRRKGDTVLVLSDHGFHGANHKDGPDGILIAAGHNIQTGAKANAPKLLDIAPTVLALLGLPAADDMDGRVLEELFTPEWGKAYPQDRIGTYDTEHWREQLPIASEVDLELRERLRALGYID